MGQEKWLGGALGLGALVGWTTLFAMRRGALRLLSPFRRLHLRRSRPRETRVEGRSADDGCRDLWRPLAGQLQVAERHHSGDWRHLLHSLACRRRSEDSARRDKMRARGLRAWRQVHVARRGAGYVPSLANVRKLGADGGR
eukprot:scaffold7095_cov260-Pinguiococcus_pyrenoidosus.AAC.24